jgi:hypothetical protein
MRSRSNDALWMGMAFCASLILAASVLAFLGPHERGIYAALAATARLAFLLFWPAYSGSALVLLFGRAFEPLKRHAREFGLAFVSALLVHLGLVVWLCLIGAAPGARTFIIFGIGAGWAYLLALFSIDAFRQALGPKYWGLLSKVGMNYLAFAFFIDFARLSPDAGLKQLIKYLPFAVLAVVGPGLRLAAFGRRARKERAASHLANRPNVT